MQVRIDKDEYGNFRGEISFSLFVKNKEGVEKRQDFVEHHNVILSQQPSACTNESESEDDMKVKLLDALFDRLHNSMFKHLSYTISHKTANIVINNSHVEKFPFDEWRIK